MKKALYIIGIFLMFTACDTPSKKEQKPVKETKPVVKKEVAKVDHTLVSLSKEPCSGDCPVFEVTVSKDSILSYHGKEYTSFLGQKKIKLTPNEYSNIIDAIKNSRFSELNDAYMDESSKDFSKTVITYNQKSVTVRLWKDAPKELTKVYVTLEDILYNHKFLE